MDQHQMPKHQPEDRDPPRVLSAEECAQVAGGWGESCYFSYSSGTSASYTSNSSGGDSKN